MTGAARTYDLLARALGPPAGDARAAAGLGLAPVDACSFALEHALLFGRAGEARVSPYEANCRGTAGLAEVVRDGLRCGWRSADDWHDRPDHASLELAIMARLAGDPAREREAAREYFARRIRPWIPAFFRDLAREEACPAHRDLARLGLAFLERQGAFPAPAGRCEAPAAPAEAICANCGRPAGFAPPAGMELEIPVCARCRIRADLRRIPR